MKRILVVLLGLALAAACDGGDGGKGGNGGRSDDPCELLTGAEVTEIMATDPVDPDGSPGAEEGVCEWGTDPLDRENIFYVVVRVESLDEATEGYPDLRTAIDEGTNVEIIDVEGLGDEAYGIKHPLADAGNVTGLEVAVGDTVLHMGWQSQDPIVRDTPRFEAVLDIARKALDRL